MLFLRNLIIKIFPFFFFIPILYQDLSYASDDGNREVKEPRYYIYCRDKDEHRSLYKFGDEIASGWFKWLKLRGEEERRMPVRTQYDFFNRSLRGVFIYYPNMDDIVVSCYKGYVRHAVDRPWSSIHSGLIDYLRRKGSKGNAVADMFLSLPEH